MERQPVTLGEIHGEDFPEAETVELTMEEMKDFGPLINKLEMQGKFNHGAIKLKPPQEYKPKVMSNQQIRELTVNHPYRMYVEEIRPGYFKFSKYINKAKEEEAKALEAKEKQRIEKGLKPTKKMKKEDMKVGSLWKSGERPLEHRFKTELELIGVYWKEVTERAQQATNLERSYLATYGSDFNASAFLEGKNDDIMTLDKLSDLLQRIVHYFEYPVMGITTPMLYLGTWLSTFAMHIEDKNLWSISYLHSGAAKIWFFLEPIDGPKLESLTFKELKSVMKKQFDHVCEVVFRHKQLLIHPDILKMHGLQIRKVIQRQGEYVVLYPYTFHWGFNCGPNVAEAINFATESWVPYGLLAKECKDPSIPFSFEMEFVVLSLYPHRYADFVNGKYDVVDPFTGVKRVIKKTPVKSEIDIYDTSVRRGGIYNFLAAKKVGNTEYVYIQLYCAKTWTTKRNAELLNWWYPEKKVRFPKFIFNMELETFAVFPKMTTILVNYKGDTTEITRELCQNANFDLSRTPALVPTDADNDNGYETTTSTSSSSSSQVIYEVVPFKPQDNPKNNNLLFPSPLKLTLRLTSKEHCQNCDKLRSKFKTTASFNRHVEACGVGAKIPCPFCSTKFTRDSNMNAHKRKFHAIEMDD